VQIFVLNHHDRNTGIPPPQIHVIFEFRIQLQEPPGLLVALRPVLSEDAAANLPGIHQLAQPFLHRDANVSALPGRSVSVNDLDQRLFLAPSRTDFSFQPLQDFLYGWPVSLEVDSLNKVPLWISVTYAASASSSSTLMSGTPPRYRVARFLIRRPPPFSLALVP
jgi:hypothetical protein